MTLRAPMLLLLSGTFVGGVASTYVVPKLLPDFGQTETSQVALATNPAKADPEPAAVSQPAAQESASAPQSVNEASNTPGCKTAVWPYLDRDCAGATDASSARPERQVRVISTDRDAPSRVPLPAQVIAQADKPADTVQTASLAAEPAPAEQAAAAPESAVAVNGSASDQVAAPRPAEKPRTTVSQPAPRRERQEKIAKAEAAVSAIPASERVETTSSISPAPEPVVKARAPAHRHVARANRPRRDMSERIRQARRNFDDDDTLVQTTTYQYADGRQIVFKSDPYRQERRRSLAADEPMAAMPRAEPQPRRADDSVLGWLFGQ